MYGGEVNWQSINSCINTTCVTCMMCTGQVSSQNLSSCPRPVIFQLLIPKGSQSVYFCPQILVFNVFGIYINESHSTYSLLPFSSMKFYICEVIHIPLCYYSSFYYCILFSKYSKIYFSNFLLMDICSFFPRFGLL